MHADWGVWVWMSWLMINWLRGMDMNELIDDGEKMVCEIIPFSGSQLSTTNFSLYNTYKIRHLVMRKWELIKQSQLLKIKTQILSSLFNYMYGLRLGEFKNTTGTERVKARVGKVSCLEWRHGSRAEYGLCKGMSGVLGWNLFRVLRIICELMRDLFAYVRFDEMGVGAL